MLKKIFRVVTNKFLVTAVLFAVWTIYFDQNDWVSMQQRQKELKNVKENITYLNTEIARLAAERNGLMADPAKIEKYARENYRMKHDGEDVYVIETDNPTK